MNLWWKHQKAALEASKGGTISGDDLFEDKSMFITSELLADYTYKLYESDKVVGMVNGENEIDLLDPVYPLFG